MEETHDDKQRKYNKQIEIANINVHEICFIFVCKWRNQPATMMIDDYDDDDKNKHSENMYMLNGSSQRLYSHSFQILNYF